MSLDVSGRLEAMGLDEVEPGIVEDTLENRRLLKMQEEVWDWDRLRDENGELTGLIRPTCPEVRAKRRLATHDLRKPILADPNDPWSDYVSPDRYPLDVWMPWWVEMRLRGWREQEDQGVLEEERRPFPVRCTQLRVDNTRCWNWAGNPDKIKLCKSHVSQTRESLAKTPAYARERLLEASINAVDNIIYLSDHADGEAVRLKANTEILDRIGISSKTEVSVDMNVSTTDPNKELQDKIAALRKRAETTVTAEPILALPPGEEVVEAELVDEETG